MYLFFRLLILLCACTIFVGADLCNYNNDGKLVLSPVQLIDMVLKERRKNKKPQVSRRATLGLVQVTREETVSVVGKSN